MSDACAADADEERVMSGAGARRGGLSSPVVMVADVDSLARLVRGRWPQGGVELHVCRRTLAVEVLREGERVALLAPPPVEEDVFRGFLALLSELLPECREGVVVSPGWPGV